MIDSQRILYVCGADFSAPSEKVALGFSLELVRRGARVMMLISGDPDTIGRELRGPVPEGLRVVSYRFRRGRLDPATIAAVRDFAPTIAHAYNPRLPVVTATRQLIDDEVPVVVNFEDDEWGLMRLGAGPRRRLPIRLAGRASAAVVPTAWPYATKATMEWTKERADVLHGITPELARQVEERLGRECEVLLPVHPGLAPGANENGSVNLPAAVDGRPVVAFTGAIFGAQAADFRLLLSAMGKLISRGSPAVLVFSGSVADRFDIDAWVEQAGIPPERFVSAGYLSFADMWALLERADVLVQPGAPTEFNRLRLPSKLQAYLSSGTPTVTFACGAGELLEDGVEVLKTHGDDPGELADRIEQILTDPELGQRLSEGGPVAAERMFGTRVNTDTLIGIYAKALQGR